MIQLLVLLVVVGLVLYLLQSLPGIDPRIKNVITVIVILIVIVWLLQAFGLVSDVRFPQLR
jgi:uncharacterized membrane protein